MFIEFARPHRLGDLIYYLELNEALALGLENRKQLRMLALQRKAYLDACRSHRVKNVLLDLKSTPFEKRSRFPRIKMMQAAMGLRGKTIFYGQAEGRCLTASSNEEFFEKLAAFRAKKIENIIGVFRGDRTLVLQYECVG